MSEDIKCVVNLSGGVCSFMAAIRAVERHGKDHTVLLFADTGEESQELHRFVSECVNFLGCEFVAVKHPLGMDGLIDKYVAIPSNRMAFCTRELKQEMCDQWIKANAPDAVRVFGFDWTEAGRIERIAARLAPAETWCPMADAPYLMKGMMLDRCRELGIEPSRQYAKGFQHDNCGGGCVKGGHAAWAVTLREEPAVYAKWEQREHRVTAIRGKPCTILRDRRGGETKPLLLSDFRELVEAKSYDTLDWGACSCFAGEDLPVAAE